MRGITKFSIAAAIIGAGSLLISYIGGPSKAAVDNTRDCDTVAIFYCGSMSESEFHGKWNNDKKYKDHATVYKAFGINKSDVKGMVSGIVWRDGRVTLGSSSNGKVVATNAVTAGRWNNPTSDMTKISGTSRAYKMSTKHFVTDGQTAMIKLDSNGNFKFAVIKSCGNPVTAKPVPQPEAACSALATPAITNRTKVSLKATASAKNGAKISSYLFTVVDASGKKVDSKTVKSTSTSASTSFTVTKAGNYTAKVTVTTSEGNKTGSQCEKNFTIKPEPAKPAAACSALATPVITNRTNVALKATASAKNGAKISSYLFTVVDASGKKVTSKTVKSTSTSASANVTVPKAAKYTAKVTVTTSEGNKTGSQCEQPFTIKEADKPGISIEKTVNGVEEDIVAVDEPFTYEIVVKNTGNVDLKDAKVEDKAPAGVTFKSADTGSIKNNAWTHTISSLKKGVEAKFKITAVVSEYFEDGRTNTACVDTPTVPGSPDDCDDATIEVKKPGVNVDKKVDGVEHKAVGVNTEFTYQIRVSNTGETDLKDVVVTDNAPNGVTFLSVSDGSVVDNKWTFTIPELKVGAVRDFTITAKVPTYLAGTIKNTVCVDAPSVPGNPDDCDDATVEVPPEPGKIKVCELATKTIVELPDNQQIDESKYSTDLSKCAEEPVTPPELPQTGITDGLLNALGLGALVTASLAYIASRRNGLVG